MPVGAETLLAKGHSVARNLSTEADELWAGSHTVEAGKADYFFRRSPKM